MLLGIALIQLGIFLGLFWIVSDTAFWMFAAIVLVLVGLVNGIDGFFVGRRND